MARKKKHRPGPVDPIKNDKVQQLRSFMRSKAGKEACDKCEGRGCWSCDQMGYYLQCPNCANEVRELIQYLDEGYCCSVCDTFFNNQGAITGMRDPEPPKKMSIG